MERQQAGEVEGFSRDNTPTDVEYGEREVLYEHSTACAAGKEQKTWTILNLTELLLQHRRRNEGR